MSVPPRMSTMALHLERVADIEPGAVVHRLAAADLRDQTLRLVQGVIQGYKHRLAQNVHLAGDFAPQPYDDGGLAVDDFVHALELAGMGVRSSLVALQLVFIGVS